MRVISRDEGSPLSGQPILFCNSSDTPSRARSPPGLHEVPSSSGQSGESQPQSELRPRQRSLSSPRKGTRGRALHPHPLQTLGRAPGGTWPEEAHVAGQGDLGTAWPRPLYHGAPATRLTQMPTYCPTKKARAGTSFKIQVFRVIGVSLPRSPGSVFPLVGFSFGQGFPWGDKMATGTAQLTFHWPLSWQFWESLGQLTGLTQLTCPLLWPGALCAPDWPSLSPTPRPVAPVGRAGGG